MAGLASGTALAAWRTGVGGGEIGLLRASVQCTPDDLETVSRLTFGYVHGCCATFNPRPALSLCYCNAVGVGAGKRSPSPFVKGYVIATNKPQ